MQIWKKLLIFLFFLLCLSRANFFSSLWDISVDQITPPLSQDPNSWWINWRQPRRTLEIDWLVCFVSSGTQNPFLILFSSGQFGVGFYSAFIVAKSVKVFTRSCQKGSRGYLWESDGCAFSACQAYDMIPEHVSFFILFYPFLSLCPIQSANSPLNNHPRIIPPPQGALSSRQCDFSHVAMT